MLSNAYFLAKFRSDTAENEPAKKFAKCFCKFRKFPDPSRGRAAPAPIRTVGSGRRERARVAAVEPAVVVGFGVVDEGAA